MKYQNIKELLSQLEEFEALHGTDDLGVFSAWLFDRYHPRDSEATQDSKPSIDANRLLSMNIGILFQHAKHYTKTALKDTALKSIFDYTLLATLMEVGDLKKSTLIQQNTLEFSSGMEVIRRLIRNGFIEDYADKEDKRSKKVRITKEGIEQLGLASKQMAKVSQIVGGKFDPQQKILAALGTLELVDFHQKIWEDDFGSDLDLILEKYLNQPNEDK